MIVAFAGHDSGSLVYHLAWRYAEEGHKVLAVDASPGCELTCRFFDEAARARLWTPGGRTFPDAVARTIEVGPKAQPPVIHPIAPALAMLAGRPAGRQVDAAILARLLNDHDDHGSREHRLERLFTAAHQTLMRAVASTAADAALVDLGHDFGAMTGSIVVTADHVVHSVATDAFSVASLAAQAAYIDTWLNLVETPGLRTVRDADAGYGAMVSAGYVVTVTPTNSRAVMTGIPAAYVGGLDQAADVMTFANDPSCLGVLHTYPGLESLAREARKPIFQLTAADGALGSHAAAVTHARNAYQRLADRIAATTWRGDALTELVK